jgi:hypothetical protein
MATGALSVKVTHAAQSKTFISRRFMLSSFFEIVQTVAMGVTGDPAAPGKRKGGAVSKNRER